MSYRSRSPLYPLHRSRACSVCVCLHCCRIRRVIIYGAYSLLPLLKTGHTGINDVSDDLMSPMFHLPVSEDYDYVLNNQTWNTQGMKCSRANRRSSQ